jgi:hypothetical protein
MKTNEMSIFAEALINNREYKNARVNGESVGVANSRAWIAAVKALRMPAYASRVYRYNHMGDAETVSACDQSTLYNALAKVLEMVGTVNGAKLNAKNCAEEIISSAVRFRVVDITAEMAHARCEKKLAKKALEEEETEETQANYDQWDAEVKRLEELPGNCKKIAEIQSETAFVKAVEILLGDAIKKQNMKSAEQVQAEEEAKRAERRAKTKAKQQAKKAQSTSTESEEKQSA